MGRRIERVKQHFRDNKKTYLACGGTAVVAVVGTVLLTNRDKITMQSISQPLSWKPQAHQTLEVHIEALGDPGNIVQDTTTGVIYASQGQAARDLGLSPARVSDQLAGKVADVQGHTFEKLGKAHVA